LKEKEEIMGQLKTTIVFGSLGYLDMPRDEFDDPIAYEPGMKIGERLDVAYASGENHPWHGFVVPTEENVYYLSEPLDLAVLLAGKPTPMTERLATCQAAWEELRVAMRGTVELPSGRLLLVGDYEVA
jgi:hypothetical protein